MIDGLGARTLGRRLRGAIGLLGAALFWGGGRAVDPVNYSDPIQLASRPSLIVKPVFTSWNDWYDAHQAVDVTLNLVLLWGTNEVGSLSPQNLVRVSNFASTNTLTWGTVPVNITTPSADGSSAASLVSTTQTSGSISFIGKFSQSFDENCWPFDEQDVYFHIDLIPPAENMLQLRLQCATGMHVPPSSWNQPEGTPCIIPFSKHSVGFSFGDISCTLGSNVVPALHDRIDCHVKATRLVQPYLIAFILPVLLFVGVSTVTMTFPVKLTMPRVAVCIIVMLQLLSLKNHVSALMPMTVEAPWLEITSLAAIFLVFLHIVGHAICFSYDRAGQPHRVALVDDLMLFIITPVWLVCSGSIYFSRGCTHNSGFFISLLVLGGLLMLLGFISIAVFYKKGTRYSRDEVCERVKV